MIDFVSDPLFILGAGVGLSVILLLFAFADDDGGKQAKRVERLRLRGQGVVPMELSLRRDAGDKTSLDQFVRRFVPRPEKLRERLRRTGYSIGLGTYGLTCLVVAAGFYLGLSVIGLPAEFAVPGALIAGLLLPHFAIGFMVNRRANRYTLLFPEAIGLMVRAIKSGLPITESFQIVGNEIPDPVGIEFRQISDQIRLGQPVESVLWDAAKRVPIPEMKFLVVTLAVQRETGGNLAETLENLDNILRRRRQMRLKIRAMSAEARASAMIIGSLPFIMMGILSVVNHDYISVLFTHHLGHMLLAAGACSLSIGIGVMAKLVRFEI